MPAKKPSTREIITTQLNRYKSNAEVLAAVRRKHPRTTLGLATVNWYRNRLRAEPGSHVPTEQVAREAANAPARRGG